MDVMGLILGILFGFCIITILLNAPLWFWSYRRKNLTRMYFLNPFLSFVPWFLLIATDIGDPTFANIVEVPIIIAFNFIAHLVILIFRLDKKGIRTVWILSIIFAVGLRLLMPSIPE